MVQFTSWDKVQLAYMRACDRKQMASMHACHHELLMKEQIAPVRVHRQLTMSSLRVWVTEQVVPPHAHEQLSTAVDQDCVVCRYIN